MLQRVYAGSHRVGKTNLLTKLYGQDNLDISGIRHDDQWSFDNVITMDDLFSYQFRGGGSLIWPIR